MFEILVASGGGHPNLRARWLTTSVVSHAIVVALATATTGTALTSSTAVRVDPAMLLFVPKPPPPTPPEARPEPPVQRLVVAEPPPKGFQTIAAPQDLPTIIPPVDLTQRPLDPRDFTGRGVEGGVADGVVGGTGQVVSDLEAGGLDAIYEATTSDERFQPATLLSQPVPKYPPALAALGVAGRVKVEFVVDTTGRVETGSVRILESSHRAFEDAARGTVLAAEFRPARFGSHPVRQLTRQAIRFVAAP
jgi:TonB family protein